MPALKTVYLKLYIPSGADETIRRRMLQYIANRQPVTKWDSGRNVT